MLVTVAGTKTFCIHQDGVQVVAHLDRSAPNPQTTSARLDGCPDVESGLLSEKTVQQETFPCTVRTSYGDDRNFSVYLLEHIRCLRVQRAFPIIINCDEFDWCIRKLRQINLVLILLLLLSAVQKRSVKRTRKIRIINRSAFNHFFNY